MKRNYTQFVIAGILIIIVLATSFLFFSPNIELPVGINAIVPLNKIVSGGPPKDGIASIDKPKFISADSVTFLDDSDLVIGVSFEGVNKVYPLMILVWHEIVNDWLDEVPILVTYCPLCYSSIVFVRKVQNEIVEFGTSGRLYKNDLVMYDRQPGNDQLKFIGSDLGDAGHLWSQFLGQAIVGPEAGQKLERIPAEVMPWKDWKKLYPDTSVLSTQTGFQRAYGVDPYSEYYRADSTFFPVENTDDRLPLKEIILGIEENEKYKAYPTRFLAERNVFNDVFLNESYVFFRVGETTVRIFEAENNETKLNFDFINGKFIDNVTNSVWNENGEAVVGSLTGSKLRRPTAHKSFWFAWADFYPTTEVQ
jgi:hypothetical protein